MASGTGSISRWDGQTKKVNRNFVIWLVLFCHAHRLLIRLLTHLLRQRSMISFTASHTSFVTLTTSSCRTFSTTSTTMHAQSLPETPPRPLSSPPPRPPCWLRLSALVWALSLPFFHCGALHFRARLKPQVSELLAPVLTTPCTL